MTYNPVVTLVDATGLPTQTTATTLMTLPSAARTAAGEVVFSTTNITYLAVDVTVTAFTGGTTPTAQFSVYRLGADGIWYLVSSLPSVNAPGVVTYDLGPGFTTQGLPNGTQHAVFTQSAKFAWTYTGTPTSVTFSASVVGR